MRRPSNKELFGKLRDAKEAVRNANVFLIDQEAIAEDAIELGYDIGGELLDVLSELLSETSLTHYAGSRPPQRSYKEEIEGLELFAFVVDSTRSKCRVYFKFALVEESLWLVSLHPNRPIQESSWKR
jgi:hypothetical protein